jgi:hypothetical protein
MSRKEFDEADLVALTVAVVVINSWNRLAISLRAPVGTISRRQWLCNWRAGSGGGARRPVVRRVDRVTANESAEPEACKGDGAHHGNTASQPPA